MAIRNPSSVLTEFPRPFLSHHPSSCTPFLSCGYVCAMYDHRDKLLPGGQNFVLGITVYVSILSMFFLFNGRVLSLSSLFCERWWSVVHAAIRKTSSFLKSLAVVKLGGHSSAKLPDHNKRVFPDLPYSAFRCLVCWNIDHLIGHAFSSVHDF